MYFSNANIIARKVGKIVGDVIISIIVDKGVKFVVKGLKGLIKSDKLATIINKIDNVDDTGKISDDIDVEIRKGACFTGDTLVLTSSGLKRIDQIKEGDLVLSKNIETGAVEYKKVLTVFKKKVTSFINITVEGELIETTPNHPFMLVSGEWIEAGNLKAGDKLVTSDGRIVEIEKIEKKEYNESREVYNLNVYDFHTYFVSKIGVLVHNTCFNEVGKVVNNMSEFFQTEFGKLIKGGVSKTKQQFQGQSIYEVTKKIDNKYLKKGDKFYLDNLHKDHLEVFDKRGNAKAVLNLDGTINVSKTEQALNEGRKLNK